MGWYTMLKVVLQGRLDTLTGNVQQGALDTAHRQMMIELSSRIKDRRVLDAFARTPREVFVPLAPREIVYGDHPLPIGFSQTVSQPYIIALMLQALSLKGRETVLEVGAGSGYQAALLAQLAAKVVSVERIPDLARDAQKRLTMLRFNNIRIETVEDVLGYPDLAPYDAIVVSAAAPRIPDTLVDQLAIGGKMTIPVGGREEQELKLVERRPHRPRVKTLALCRFVPLIGEGAWPS